MDRGKTSLKQHIIVLFIALVIAMFGISGYMVFTTWMTSSENTIDEIQETVGDQIFRRIDSFAEIPLRINNEYFYLIQNEIVDFRDERKREIFFANLIRSTQEDVYSFSYGTESGEYYGARRNERDEIEIYKNNAGTYGKTRYYKVNPELSAGEFMLETDTFDPRTRDWYQMAKGTQGPVFSPIYKHFVMNDLALTAARPVYDKEHKLAGVLGTHITLSRLNSYLKKIVTDSSGIVYIVEKNTGYLVANSLGKPNFHNIGNRNIKRITADEIEEKEIVEAYHSRQNNRTTLLGSNQLFIKLIDYKKMGLEWLIIVAIPKSPFMIGLMEGTYVLGLLTLLMIFVAIFLYIKSADILLAPINNLIITAEKFTAGDFSERARIFRNDEIGILSKAFNRMAAQFDLLINSLEERIKERTFEQEQTNQKLRRSVEIQAVLREIAEAAVRSPSLNELYRAVHQSVERVLPAKNLYISLLDEATGQITRPYCVDETNSVPRQRPVGKGLTEYFMRQGSPVHITPTVYAELEGYGNLNLYPEPVFECIGAPLSDSQGKVFGVITLFVVEETLHFQPNDLEVISIIAAQVSMAIERKQAEEAMKSSQDRYRALMEQSFEALAVIDIQTQEVVEVNRRFTELLGYSLPEDAPLYASNFVLESKENLDGFFKITLKKQQFLLPEAKIFRHKNGTEVPVERAGTVISVDGRDIYLDSMRDMTSERRRQAELIRDVEFARRVQQGLLPELPDSPFVTIRSLYYPSHFVSGDSYHLEWDNEGKLLRGFLIDVSGHGLATAIQTSSINVLLREAAMTHLPLFKKVRWVNARAAKYFTDGAYAAMLGFELDLSRRELRYVGAGITQFYANGRKRETPGMFVGIWDDAEFIEGVLPVSEGDTFCFLTDGFTDWLTQPKNAGFWSPEGQDLDADVASLERLAGSGTLRDDATGVCLKIRELEKPSSFYSLFSH